GANQTDYSGYPDCRKNSILAMEKALRMGMDYEFIIHSPLMLMTKAQGLKMAEQLGALKVMHLTHTCYMGMRPPCGKCPACLIRAKGFNEAGIKDPLIELGHER
ncbi:MAG: 7-cyano-7-deazaguanine synthase, partial [bacterium]